MKSLLAFFCRTNSIGFNKKRNFFNIINPKNLKLKKKRLSKKKSPELELHNLNIDVKRPTIFMIMAHFVVYCDENIVLFV